MKKVSFLFAVTLVAAALTGCHRDFNDNNGYYNQGYGYGNSPFQSVPCSRSMVVRVDPRYPNNAQYAEMTQAPQGVETVANQQQNWQAVGPQQMITQTQGYPQAQQGAYFIQNPAQFDKSQPQGAQLNASYIGGNYGCGFCHYPNYGGYGGGNPYSHYYYPNYYNYSPYAYLPTYYYNYSYYYYQPYAYYPYGNYNYYVYTTW